MMVLVVMDTVSHKPDVVYVGNDKVELLRKQMAYVRREAEEAVKYAQDIGDDDPSAAAIVAMLDVGDVVEAFTEFSESFGKQFFTKEAEV